jgi:hypothetical protein
MLHVYVNVHSAMPCPFLDFMSLSMSIAHVHMCVGVCVGVYVGGCVGVRAGMCVYVHACVCVSLCTWVRGGVCMYSCLCARVLMLMYKCRNAGLSSIRSVWYQNKKTIGAGTGLVTDQACAVQHFFGLVLD